MAIVEKPKPAATPATLPERKENTIERLLQQNVDKFREVLPLVITPDKFVRVALFSIKNNQRLMQCSTVSLMAALMRAAQAGVTPDGVRAALVPYKNEATFIMMYQGLIEKILESGKVSKIYAQAVFSNDKFDYALGLNERLEHTPSLGDRGVFVGVYAYAITTSGSYMDYMSMEDVDRIRSRSRAKDNGPWVTDYVEMARKTVVRRLAKYLPKGGEISMAVADQDAIDVDIDIDPVAAATEAKTRALAEKLESPPLAQTAPEPQAAAAPAVEPPAGVDDIPLDYGPPPASPPEGAMGGRPVWAAIRGEQYPTAFDYHWALLTAVTTMDQLISSWDAITEAGYGGQKYKALKSLYDLKNKEVSNAQQ